MKKLTHFFLSKVLYHKIYDESGKSIGKLWDMYVTSEKGYPIVVSYKLKVRSKMHCFQFSDIEFIMVDGKIIINAKGAKETTPPEFSYLLSRQLLDKQIVDIDGKKLIRVDDLRLGDIGGTWRVAAVDTGGMALARRLGIDRPITALMKVLGKKPGDTLIIWDNVETLGMGTENLKLSVPYQKLSKMHPADLADILEDMDAKYRNKVFQSLDVNLAADTLEEIEPDVQADILESLNENKTADVLDNVPNDEIADMLDEVDEETAEKILSKLEKNDADEVRTLMEYEEKTIGSIMNKDYIAFYEDLTAEQTIDRLRELKPDAEVAYYIYITDKEEKLQGVVSLRNLVVSDPYKKLKDIMDINVLKVRDKDSIDSAIELAVKYDLLSLPVINSEYSMCGIVIMPDIVDEVFIPNWKRKLKKVG